MCGLVKESRLVVVHPLEDGTHQSLAYQPTAIGNAVLTAELVQYALFTVVEQDAHPVFARLLVMFFV